MTMPTSGGAMQFEKVELDKFLKAKIGLQYDSAYKKLFKGEEKVYPAWRLILEVEGCQYPKYSKWYKFSYHERAGLYKDILQQLVEGATPKMQFHIEQLHGMDVLVRWDEVTYPDGRVFQVIDKIKPAGEKIKINPDFNPDKVDGIAVVNHDSVGDTTEEVPF